MKNILIKKLNEDDILEILIEHFQKGKYSESQGCGKILGTPGQDLRFVAVINCGEPKKFDLDEIDRISDYNGEHDKLTDYPEFDLSK